VTPDAAPRSRVVVAIDEAKPSAVSLDIARQLFDSAATELIGVFVEDQRLFAHAASRLAREVAFSGQARSFDAATLERQLRASARAARHRFEADAARFGVKHVFQVLRGDPATEITREAIGAEALVVGLASSAPLARQSWHHLLRQLTAARVPAMLFAHESWLTGRDIVALIEEPASTDTALTTALRLAQRSRSALTLLYRSSNEAERRHAAELTMEIAASMNVELRGLVSTGNVTAETLLRATRGARLLVLPRHGGRDQDLIGSVVTRAATSVLLVGEPLSSDAGDDTAHSRGTRAD
jgi:hypothetical protein